MIGSLAFIKRVLAKLLVTVLMVGAIAESWSAPPIIDGDGREIVEPPHSGWWAGSLRLKGANSDFDIQRHGFRFVNSWDDVHVNLPKPFGDVDLETESFGLCGGMIYAAHDSFYMESTSGRPVQTPEDAVVPEPGSDLRGYIWDRQMDSLKRDGWWALRALVQWIRESDANLRYWTWESFTRKVAPGNNNGWAIPLMVVINRNPTKLTGNHQVLAIGYEPVRLGGGEGSWRVKVYDPNCPSRESYLNLWNHTNSCSGSKFRGFFVSKNKGQYPYWGGKSSYGPWTPDADLPPLRDGLGIDKGLPKPEALPEGEGTAFRPAPAADDDQLDDVTARFVALEQRIVQLENAAIGDVAVDESNLTPSIERDLTRVGPGVATEGIEIVPGSTPGSRTGSLQFVRPESFSSQAYLAVLNTDGENLASGYGSLTTNLLPGDFSIKVMKGQREGVPVRAGQTTRVLLSAVRINFGGNTPWSILSSDGSEAIASGYGSGSPLLLPGEYVIDISGTRETFTVEPGEVLEY